MAFVLIDFYEENVCDIIPTSDVILDDQTGNIVKTGMKTLVYWRNKGKGRAALKAPAEILVILGL